MALLVLQPEALNKFYQLGERLIALYPLRYNVQHIEHRKKYELNVIWTILITEYSVRAK
jgi:hypothetical protein